MKIFKFVCMAAFWSIAFASCVNEAYLDLGEEQSATATTCNAAKFDGAEHDAFKLLCDEIISVHLDMFYEYTPADLIRPIAKGSYTTGEAVALICFWLNDKHCGDIIAEWPSVDAFVIMLPSYGYDKDGNYLYND